MKPVEFHGHNVVFGKEQPQYQPLPAQVFPDGQVITCWEFTDDEIERLVKTKRIYLQQLTFGLALQPITPVVELGDDIELYPDAT